MHEKIVFITIILISMYAILVYCRNCLLYNPLPANVNPEKYERFYQKLLKMVENKNNLLITMVNTTDGIKLDTIYLKNPLTDKCIIFFHGNAGNIAMRFDMIKFFYDYVSTSVIAFDYRSFGRSTCNNSMLSASGLELDTMTIWNFAIKNLNIKPNNIILLGESLGCALAIYLAAELSCKMDSSDYPRALVLNSPFYSLDSMIENTFHKISKTIGKLLAFIVGGEYPSYQWIKYVNHWTKIIIAHSPRDEIVPYREGVNLFNTVKQIRDDVIMINLTGTHNSPGLTDSYIYALADILND